MFAYDHFHIKQEQLKTICFSLNVIFVLRYIVCNIKWKFV